MAIALIKNGDIFESDCEALVNAVNCVGVMGKGLALQVKQRFPAVFAAYQKECRAGKMRLGEMQIVPVEGRPKFVINFPTKFHWREGSSYQSVEDGLVSLRQEILRHRIQSVAVPALGCGLGGLSWGKVFPMIEKSLGQLDGVKLLVYAPGGPQ